MHEVTGCVLKLKHSWKAYPQGLLWPMCGLCWNVLEYVVTWFSCLGFDTSAVLCWDKVIKFTNPSRSWRQNLELTLFSSEAGFLRLSQQEWQEWQWEWQEPPPFGTSRPLRRLIFSIQSYYNPNRGFMRQKNLQEKSSKKIFKKNLQEKVKREGLTLEQPGLSSFLFFFLARAACVRHA